MESGNVAVRGDVDLQGILIGAEESLLPEPFRVEGIAWSIYSLLSLADLNALKATCKRFRASVNRVESSLKERLLEVAPQMMRWSPPPKHRELCWGQLLLQSGIPRSMVAAMGIDAVNPVETARQIAQLYLDQLGCFTLTTELAFLRPSIPLEKYLRHPDTPQPDCKQVGIRRVKRAKRAQPRAEIWLPMYWVASLSSIQNLKGLDLTKCNLHMFDGDLLKGSQNLKHLTLSYNHLKHLRLEALPELFFLRLEGNPLSELKLIELPRLSFLDLSDEVEAPACRVQITRGSVPWHLNGNISLCELIDCSTAGHNYCEEFYTLGTSCKDFCNLRRGGRVVLDDRYVKRLSLQVMRWNFTFILPNLHSLSFAGVTEKTVEIPFLPNLCLFNCNSSKIEALSFQDLPTLESVSIYSDKIQRLTLRSAPKLWHLCCHSQLSHLELPDSLPEIRIVDLMDNCLTDCLSILRHPDIAKLPWRHVSLDGNPGMRGIHKLTRFQLTYTCDYSPRRVVLLSAMIALIGVFYQLCSGSRSAATAMI